MSDNIIINFYRLGTADINTKGRNIILGHQFVKWNRRLKGLRSIYFSLSIISSPSGDIKPPFTIESLFGKKIS